MHEKIFLTMVIVTVCLLALIGWIGGECDTDAKEWLMIFTMISFGFVVISALCQIWL